MITPSLSIPDLLKVSKGINKMQYEDEDSGKREFEWFVESISIVLPNCDEWINQHMKYVS